MSTMAFPVSLHNTLAGDTLVAGAFLQFDYVTPSLPSLSLLTNGHHVHECMGGM